MIVSGNFREWKMLDGSHKDALLVINSAAISFWTDSILKHVHNLTMLKGPHHYIVKYTEIYTCLYYYNTKFADPCEKSILFCVCTLKG